MPVPIISDDVCRCVMLDNLGVEILKHSDGTYDLDGGGTVLYNSYSTNTNPAWWIKYIHLDNELVDRLYSSRQRTPTGPT